jgi:hypothetical protein
MSQTAIRLSYFTRLPTKNINALSQKLTNVSNTVNRHVGCLQTFEETREFTCFYGVYHIVNNTNLTSKLNSEKLQCHCDKHNNSHKKLAHTNGKRVGNNSTQSIINTKSRQIKKTDSLTHRVETTATSCLLVCNSMLHILIRLS